MSLHAKLQQREAAGKPIRVGLIGAGRSARCSSPRCGARGLHLAGIADLAPAGANLLRAGRLAGRSGRRVDLDDALRSGTAKSGASGEDWQALVSHPAIDVVVDAARSARSTPSPTASRRSGTASAVVDVTVEADAFCGPLLARKAAEAGVVYSLAFGDQPALICGHCDWARASGFPASAGRRSTSGCRTSPNRPRRRCGATTA